MNPRSTSTCDSCTRTRVADVESLLAADHLPFDRRRHDPHPRALSRAPVTSASNSSPDARRDDQRGRRFPHLALDLVGRVLLRRAVRRQAARARPSCRATVPGERRLEQTLRQQIGIAAVGRRRVRVVLHGEPEMAGRLAARRIDDVLARSEQLDDRQRQIRKAVRIGVLPRGGGTR